jgi:tetratricopeptide (TPR) repeat protein
LLDRLPCALRWSRESERNDGADGSILCNTGKRVSFQPRLKILLLALLMVAMTLAAYAPALRAGFIWDDDDYVTENPLLSEPDGLSRIWLSMDAPSQYFPMVYTMLRVEFGLWGLDPLGYHLVNVLLHAANALLLWQLLRRLDIGMEVAWFAAAIFALHPVHVESVAWIAERKNLLSFFFALASLLAWLRHLERPGRSLVPAYLTSVLLYALALLSKATACTLPAVMLLLVWLRGGAISRRRLTEVFPFVVLGILMGLLVVIWERLHIGTVGERFELSAIESLLVASRAVWFYLGKLVWPTQLAFSYPRFEIDSSDPVQYLWLLAGVLLLSSLWRYRERIGRAPLVAALYFVSVLSPVLGFIPLFTFWYTFVADHYQYMASVGPIALFIAGSVHALRSRGFVDPRILGSAGLGLLVVLGAMVFEQSRIYENRETLWRDTIEKHPSSWMAHVNLGRTLLAEARFEESISAYEEALRIRPETYRAHIGIAEALAGLGREQEGRSHFEAVLALQPEMPGLHGFLANLAWRRGEHEMALGHYRAAIELDPQNAKAHFLYGRRLAMLERAEEARLQFERVLALEPGHTGARRALSRGAGRRAKPKASSLSEPR